MIRPTYTPQRLTELATQHGMDGGGYTFDAPEDHPLVSEAGACIWEDPDLDYILGSDVLTREQRYGPGIVTLAWRPLQYFETASEWPEGFSYGGQWHFPLCNGSQGESDATCGCHGEANPDEPGGWEYTGNYLDDPNPKCPKCEGEGYFTREGGVWALFGSRDQKYPLPEPYELPDDTGELDRWEYLAGVVGGPLNDDGDNDDDTIYDVGMLFPLVEGLYWYAVHNHVGMWSGLYALQCRLSRDFKPGYGSEGGTAGEDDPHGEYYGSNEVYEWLGGGAS